MNKKIISLIMASAFTVSAAPVLAEEVTADQDIMVISSKVEYNEYNGTVAGIKENVVTVEIDGVCYGFIFEGEKAFEIGDEVAVKTEDTLKTKNIKTAVEITAADASGAVEDVVDFSYNRYDGKVQEIKNGVATVTIDGIDYGFTMDENTAVYSIAGEKAEVKKNDDVIVVSQASLRTKDIKPADAIIVKDGKTEMAVFLDTFAIKDDALISADGELVLNVEDSKQYDGKKLLVFYNMMTMSIPAQTNPEKIVVLGDDAEAPADEEPAKKAAAYNKYEGVVDATDKKMVGVTIDGIGYSFIANNRIYTIDGNKAKEIKKGDKVIVVSTSSLMTKDIKTAAAIVILDSESATNVYADKFNIVNDELISGDGELILNVKNAKKYDGKNLLVFYDAATASIPAQTNPIKVVELNDSVRIAFNFGDRVLNINGNKVEVEKPYIAGTGVTLVPLRVISEAFGAEVIWDGETKSVTINHNGITIKVTIDDVNAVTDGDMVEKLEAAPQLTKDGVTMIPLRFISEKLGATVGYDDATSGITVEMD